MGRLELETYRTEELESAESVRRAEQLSRSILSGVTLAIDWTPGEPGHRDEPCGCAQCIAVAEHLSAYERSIISGFVGATRREGGRK